MLVRDSEGIICQHSPYDPYYCDGGDSAARTGILAACGSDYDRIQAQSFVIEGLGVRHPTQVPYNNPNSFTRDQLIQLTAGLEVKQARALLISHAKRGFICQNSHETEGAKKAWYKRDILTPSHIGHLILKSKTYLAYPFLLISMPWLLLDILWSTKVAPMKEQNQIICMLLSYPSIFLALYRKLHPCLEASLQDYWGGWRDQVEIKKAILLKISIDND